MLLAPKVVLSEGHLALMQLSLATWLRIRNIVLFLASPIPRAVVDNRAKDGTVRIIAESRERVEEYIVSCRLRHALDGRPTPTHEVRLVEAEGWELTFRLKQSNGCRSARRR